MSRYADDLRKIVGIDELKKEIKELSDKAPIESLRALAYQDSKGIVRTAVGAAGGSGSGITAPEDSLGTDESAVQEGASDAAADASASQSNTSTPRGGNVPLKTDTDGKLDLTDIIDNFADRNLGITSVNNPGFSRTLSAINGWTDCEEGTSGEVRFDSYVPPLTWADAETPPLDSTYTPGRAWKLAVGGSSQGGASFNGMIAAAQASSHYPGYTFYTIDAGGIITSRTPTAGSRLFMSHDPTGQVGDNMGYLGGASFVYNAYSPGVAITVGYGVEDCGLSPAYTAAACAADPPYETSWNNDYFQLVPDDNGSFVASVYDTNVPVKYTAPNASSTAYMCFDSGRQAVLTPGANGTKLLYEVDPATGIILPDAVIHIYNGNGQLVGYADSTAYEQYAV